MAIQTLIIVDMLNDFIDPKGALYCGSSSRTIVPFIRERLDHYRRQNGLIIFLQDAHDPDDKEFEKFPPHCIKGTWGDRIIDELSPLAGEHIIPKKRYSGFYETNLGALLRSYCIDTVEVVGVCTSICVMDTVGGLSNRDYSVVVPEKGVADLDPNFHHFSLKRMEQIYGATII